MIERRKLERYRIEIPATVAPDAGGPSPAGIKTRDISAAGAFFLTPEPLPRETAVVVNLMLPELRQSPGRHAAVKLKGTVVRTGAAGMAVSFHKSFRMSSLAGLPAS
jgi:hypothetical protein